MAAHLAELREDDAAAWEHWLRAAADRSSPFGSIYLQRALSPNLTASQMTASIQTLRALIEDHPRNEVRLEARRQLIRLYERRERLDEARRIGDDVETIRQWQLIGPFDNDQGRGFFAVYPPEQDADLTTEHRGLRLPVRWRPVTTIDRGGRVHIDGHVSPSQWALAYLNTFVHSGAAREVGAARDALAVRDVVVLRAIPRVERARRVAAGQAIARRVDVPGGARHARPGRDVVVLAAQTRLERPRGDGTVIIRARRISDEDIRPFSGAA